MTEKVNINSMKFDELKEYAKSLGIEFSEEISFKELKSMVSKKLKDTGIDDDQSKSFVVKTKHAAIAYRRAGFIFSRNAQIYNLTPEQLKIVQDDPHLIVDEKSE